MPGSIVILSAIDRELQQVVQRLNLRWQENEFAGTYQGKSIRARFTGMGERATLRAIDAIARDGSVSRVIHVGFAGGLDPALNTGDVVHARWIVNAADGRVAVLEADRVKIESSDVADRKTRATLLTSAQLVPTVGAKADLFKRWNAAAVEMESFHAAAQAAERGLRFSAIRAVSDRAEFVLLPEAMQWVKADGRSDTAAAAKFAITHPWHIPALLKLGQHAGRAAHALAVQVEWLIASEA